MTTTTVARQSAPTLEGLPRLTAANVTAAKRSILYKGDSGDGKSTCAFSWPQPIEAAYTDPNLGVLQGLIESGADVNATLIENWEQFNDRWLPMAANRLLRARTLVVDSWDFLAEMMWHKVQGSKPKLAIQDFGTGLDLMSGAMRQLIDVCRPMAGKPAYNLVVTCGVKTETDDNGSIVKIGPAIMGAFKDRLERYFNTVLLCDSAVSGDTVTDPVTKATKVVPKARWFVHTVPPNAYHTCKDSIGGTGRLAKLPAQTGGLYPELCRAWGCDPEPSGWPIEGTPNAAEMKPIND